MALNTLNTGAISFKKLNGKAHTQQGFAFTEEGITSNVQMSYTTVFANSIEKLPVTNSGLTTLYSNNGIVQRVKFEVDIIPNTQIAVNQSQGYRLKLPADWNANGNLFPTYVTGTYLHTALGRLQIVPSLYGELKIDGTTEYDPILYQTNGSIVIPKFDPIDWILDTYNGILFVQNPPVGYDVSASRPAFVEAYLYVGDYVSDILAPSSGSSSGMTTASNVGSGVGVFKDKVVADLRFKSLTGNNGISVNGGLNDITISYTGTSGGGTITGGTNGLSVTGTNIKLGGTVTGSTIIGLGSFNLTFTGTTGTLRYGSDLSAQYTNRSLVDKGYVDGIVSGFTGTSLNIYSPKLVISGNTTLNSMNYVVLCNTTSSGFTITLPASPVDGQAYKIKDVGIAYLNNITINGNGKNIDGSSTILINTDKGAVELCFDLNLNSWFVLSFVN